MNHFDVADRLDLRAKILRELKAEPLPLTVLIALAGQSEKRVYREVLVMQETKAIVRIGGGRQTRYGLPEWAPAPKPAAVVVAEPAPTASWWITDDFATAARREQPRLMGSKFGRSLPVSTIG